MKTIRRNLLLLATAWAVQGVKKAALGFALALTVLAVLDFSNANLFAAEVVAQQHADGLTLSFEEQKAKAEKGDADAQCWLGECYRKGKSVAKDMAEAFKWYRKAAEQGNADAQFWIGSSYYDGRCVAKDRTEAFKWYRKAAEQGNGPAQAMLGICYYYGQGRTEEKSEAVNWFRKAAEQGDAGSNYRLGNCYADGQGVAKDESEAAKWYRKAAEQGSRSAQVSLGSCYYNGEGVAKDYAIAVKWWRKAAEQGNRSAQASLGRCYFNGEGVAKDYTIAVRWFRKAAEQGDARAQYWLGECCKDGRGVLINYVEAHRWLSLASAQDSNIRVGGIYLNYKVKESLSKIKERMTDAQIAEAKRLAHKFKPATEAAMSSDITSAQAVPLPTQQLTLSDAARTEWPQQVSLTGPSAFPVMASGKQIGSVTFPVGTLVKVVGVEGESVVVVCRNATATIPASATDFFANAAAQRQARSVQEQSLEKQNEVARLASESAAEAAAEIAKLRSLPFIDGKVLQVLPNGLLIHCDRIDEDVYLVGYPDSGSVVEGNRVWCYARQEGRFQYRTVLGATRTIRKHVYCGK